MNQETRCELCGCAVPVDEDGFYWGHLKARHSGQNWPERQRKTTQVRLSDDRSIGAPRSATYALAIWPTDVVSRATIRALLIEEGTKSRGAIAHNKLMNRYGSDGGINRTSQKFRKCLKSLEDAGMIQRGEEFILIKNRRALLDRALDGIHNPSHRKFLRLNQAAEKVSDELRRERRPKVHAQRSAELRFIRSLMSNPEAQGSMRSGTTAVRFVPPSRPL